MKIGVWIEGEAPELGVNLERLGRALQREFGADKEGVSNEGGDGLSADIFRKVWNRITPKAREAMKSLFANSAGLTKEQIVESVDLLADTRDLGGALSSIARVCKALKVPHNQEAIYRKHDESDGRVLYRLTDAARECLAEYIP